MGSEILLIVSSLLFYLLGYYSGNYSQTAQSLLKKGKRFIAKPKGMIIEAPSAEDYEYRGSEQERIDKSQMEAAKKAGLIK